MGKTLISIVVPCYNEEKTIELFMHKITEIEKEMSNEFNTSFEYIFVDDGSKDSTSSIRFQYSMNRSHSFILLDNPAFHLSTSVS